MMNKIQTRDEQRARNQHRASVGFGLHCHLENLVSEILAGDSSKLSEFQQFIQYAPPEMRDRLLDKIDKLL